jgi:organic radical activating enzyme
MQSIVKPIINDQELLDAKINFQKHKFREHLITKDDFKEIIKNKEVYIFGATLEGCGFQRLLKKEFSKSINAFIDTRENHNNTYKNTIIIHPDIFFNNIKDKNIFIIIATKHREYRKIAIKKCEENGLKKIQNFIYSYELCDSFPIVEPVGSCNLKCVTCTVGISDFTKGGIMKISDYERCLEKLKKDIPWVNSIYLYLWGEPLMHPKIGDFVKLTHEYGLSCDISTNLNLDKRIDELIEAEPDILTLACSGTGANYEVTHTGGKWDKFEKNLEIVKKSIDKHNADIDVRFYYHIYKHNLNDDYDYCFNLAKKYNFQWLPIIAQLFNEHVYKHVILGDPLPREYLGIKDKLITNYKDQLERAYKKKNAFCPTFKCFPTIRWDLSVAHCSMMTKPSLTSNYLETDFEDLKKRRDNEETCIKCMSKGVHRFFDVSYIKIDESNGKRTAIYKDTEKFKA